MAAEFQIYELPRRRRTGAAASTTAEQFKAWIEAELPERLGRESSSPKQIHQAVMLLAWELFYAYVPASAGEQEAILAQWLATMRELHTRWLKAEKIPLVEEKIVRVPAPIPEEPTPPRTTIEALESVYGSR